MSLRAILLAVWAVMTLAVGGGLWWLWANNDRITLAPDALGRGDYRLVTATGAPFDQSNMVGRPSAVFFGFTHCPDVCPTTLGDIALWQEALGADAERLQVVFVTVDPARDTPEVLAGYTGWLPVPVTAVTGSQAEIDKMIAAFHIFARKVPLEGGDYTMDHHASVLLFDRAGQFVGQIPYQSTADTALEKIRPLL